MSDLNTEISITANADGVEAGVGRAKRSLADLGATAKRSGQDAADGVGKIGLGGDAAARKVDAATRSMQNSIQRLVAEQKAGEKGSRAYWEALADTRGVSAASLKPYLDQLDQVKAKTSAAKAASEDWMGSLRSINGLLAGLGAAVSIGGISAFVKQSIDAADSMSKLSQKSGVAVESLVELNYAASLSDVSTEGLATGLRKLSQNMAEAAKGSKEQAAAFAAVGVNVQNLDGSLKGADEVLKELATRFSNFKDGPEKAALAIELFGKQGAELIPLLNGGAAGLSEMADEARSLGVVFGADLAKNAETFNDNLTRIQASSQGAATAIAGQLLPTLNLLTQEFIAAKDGSQSFATSLGGGLRTVVESATILYANVSFVLQGIGREIGAIGAQFAAIGRGDFSGWTAISDAVKADGKRARAELDKFTFDLLNAGILTSKAGAGRGTAPDPRSLGDTSESAPIVRVAEKAAKAAKEAQSEYDKLMQKLGVELPKASAAAEAAQMGYNKAQTEFIALVNSPAWAKFTDQERSSVALKYEGIIASEQAMDAQKLLDKANLDAAASREKYVASLATGITKIRADIVAQQEATARMGLTKDAVAELDAAKLEMLATDLELQAIKALDRNLDQQTYDSLKMQAQLYRDLAVAKKDGAAKEIALDLEKANEDAAKEAQREWQRTADDINRSLTDALLRGFESGKDFAKNMRDTIVNMFKTLVLRPIISAVVNPVAGAITGALGLAGTASAATGGAGGANILSTLQTGFSAINGSISSTISSAFGKFAGSSVGQSLGLSNAQAIAGNNPLAFLPAGGQLTGTGQALGSALGVVGNTLAGYAMGSMARSLISNGYSAGKGMDTFQKVGIAVGSAIGGPLVGAVIGAGAGVFNQLFGRKLKDSGIQGTFGGQSGFEGESYEFYKGGLLRSDKTKTNPLAEEVRKTLGDAFSAMRVEVGTFATALGLETDRLATFTTSIKISTQGLDDKAAQEKIQNALATANNELAEQVIGSWQRTVETISRSVSTNVGGGAEGGDFVTSVYDEVVTNSTYIASEYAKTGEKAIDTLTRLATSMSTVNAASDALGYGFHQASLAAAAAASNIVDAFGGLEAFSQTIGSYLTNFYSDAERKSATARQVARALGDAGLDIDPRQLENVTRPAIRAFVETIGAQFGFESKEYVTAVQQANVLATITEPVQQLTQTAAVFDNTADEAARAADEAARAWQQITDGLLTDRTTAEIALLRAQGREEEALARERAKAIEGFDAYQIGLYDGTQAILSQVTALEKQAEATKLAQERAAELASTLAGELPGVIDKFLAPAQREAAQYQRIAGSLNEAGIGVTADALMAATKEQIASVAMQVYNLGTTSDETRLAILRAASGLADLKDSANAANIASADTAYAALERAVSKQRNMLQETVADVREVFDAVRTAARELFGEVESAAAMQASAGRKFISDALSSAKLTGYLPDGKDLQEAIGAARAGIGASVYASQADADYERLVLANELRDLQSISGDQLTEAEKQIKALDSILDTSKAQLDALKGIDSSVLSVAEALSGFRTAMGKAGGGTAGAAGTTITNPVNGKSVFNGLQGAQFDAASGTGYLAGSGLPWNVDSVRAEAEALLASGQNAAVIAAIKGQGYTHDQAEKILGIDLPQFRVGTNYVPHDMAAIVHKGEAIVPKAYNPAALGVGSNSSRVEALLEGMAKEIQRLQAIVRDGNNQQRRTANAVNGAPEMPMVVEIA